MAVAVRRRLKVIEDACEAIGAEHGGRKVGSIGDAGVFAFYPNKQITTGEGGVIVTDDAALADAARRMHNQGRDPSSDWFEHVELGYNYRISDINCALGVEQLRRIEAILRLRESVAHRYEERLKDEPRLLLPDLAVAGGRVSWFVYVVRLGGRFARARSATGSCLNCGSKASAAVVTSLLSTCSRSTRARSATAPATSRTPREAPTAP